MPVLFDWLMTAVDRRTAGAKAGHALIFHDTYLSFRGLLHRVERRARELNAIGLRKGDWVGLMLGNDPELVVLAIALSKLAAVVVPLDPTMGSRDLDMTLEATPLRALITRPNAMDPLAAPAGALRMAGQNLPPKVLPESRHRLTGTLLSCSLYAVAPPNLADGFVPEVALFTLDAGGDPKAVLRGASQLEGIAHSLGKTLGLNEESRVLCAAPLHDSQGFDFGLLAALPHGATLFLDDGTAGPRMAKLLVDHRINLYISTPRDYAALARVSSTYSLEGQPTRFVCSGPPVPEVVARAFHRRFGRPVHSCYQSCEAGPIAIDLTGESPESVGKPFANVDLRITPSKGDHLENDDSGAILVRSPSVSPHYLPELPSYQDEIPIGRTSPEGWLRTGDRGALDPKGHLCLRDREDDLVKVDRRRVALGEVESCLERMDNVRAAEARVEYDDAGSSRIVVAVTPGGRCRPKLLIDNCAKQLAPYKVPSRIEITE
jgi:acyl-CoA synthetase (AMP-forming)/AMP-acid ligase II